MPCDICNRSGSGTIVPAAQFSSAVSAGFNPFQLGCIPENLLNNKDPGFPARWAESAMHGSASKSDWDVCPNCMSKLQAYLAQGASASEQPAPTQAPPITIAKQAPVTPALSVEGDCLKVRDGVTLPRICILTGRTDNLISLEYTLTRSPNWVWFFLLLPFIFLILVKAIQETSGLTLYINQEVESRRKAWGIANYILPFVLFPLSMVCLLPIVNAVNPQSIIFILLMLTPLLLAIVIPIIIYQVKIKLFSVKKIKNGFIWMKLRDPALIPTLYAAQFQQMPAQPQPAGRPDQGRTTPTRQCIVEKPKDATTRTEARTVLPQQHATTPEATRSSSADSTHDRIMRMLNTHLARVRTERHETTLKVLDELEARFSESSLAISAMVEQTLADRKLHTKAIGGGGIRTWLLVSAVPSDRFNSVHFFSRINPPGYFGYIDFWLNSQPLKVAREMGHDVFAHVLVYADASSNEPLSIGIGLLPLNPALKDANPLMIVPEESLTREEKTAMGG